MATNAIFYNGKWFPNIVNKIKAKSIEYDNSSSGLTSGDLQNAINELKTGLDNKWKTIYPVGSIYFSVNNTNPKDIFGGTWEAYGTADTYLRLGGNSSGGNSSVSYTPIGTVGSHSHYYTPSGTVGSHSHYYTPAGSNSGGSVSGHTLTVNEMPSHAHTLYGHAFNWGGTDTTVYAPVQAYTKTQGTTTPENYLDTLQGWWNQTKAYGGGGSHNHGFTNPTFSGTRKGTESTTPSFTGTRAISESTTPSFTGTASTIKIEPSYIQVYAWRRIA